MIQAKFFIFDPKSVEKWRIAKKTKGLRAKAMVNLLVDRSVMSKFLIDTLEAKEPIHENTMFCIGEGNDAWQQAPKTLLKKYDVTDIDADGWMICQPKAENSVDFYEVPLSASMLPSYIVGLWGETVDGIQNLQAYEPGDFIARSRENPVDVWVVRRKIWLNSYTELST